MKKNHGKYIKNNFLKSIMKGQLSEGSHSGGEIKSSEKECHLRHVLKDT